MPFGAAITRQALAEALGNEAPGEADVDLTARALIGAGNELLVGYIRGELAIDRRRLTDHLVTLFLVAAPLSSSAATERPAHPRPSNSTGGDPGR